MYATSPQTALLKYLLGSFVLTFPQAAFQTMKTLAPGKWLSDEPINKLLTIIATLGSANSSANFGVVSSFHVSNTPANKPRQRYIEQMIAKNTTLLVPIHGQDHWMSAIVYPAEHRVDIYEPMNRSSFEKYASKCVDTFLSAYFKDANQYNWARSVMAGPFQSNKHDCGVIAVVTAIYILASRQMPKGIDGWTWRLIFHCLLRVSSDNVSIDDAAAELQRALLVSFPPPALPDNYFDPPTLVHDPDKGGISSDLSVWESDAKAKIEKLDRALEVARSSRPLEEPLQALGPLKSRALKTLSEVLPEQMSKGINQEAQQEALTALEKQKIGSRNDRELWQKLHFGGRYESLTSQGMAKVDEALKANKNHAAAIQGLGGIQAVFDAAGCFMAQHQEGTFTLEEERRNLQDRIAGLRKLAGGAPRHVKRERGWESN